MNKKKKIIITGGNGFIGSHIVEAFLKNTDMDIVVLDKLSYSSSGHDRLKNIKAFDDKRVSIFTADLTLPISEGVYKEIGEDVEYIIHLAAESHVDNSITNPVPFMQNNYNNAIFMLEYARKLPNLKKFIYFSTDEVYGTAPKGTDYVEGDRYNPGNPYSASKASAECICYAYSNTFKVPIMITNTMNVIGERQHPEKFVPLIINRCLDGKELQIHADSTCTEAGSRFYIHARNVADALLFLVSNINEFLDNIDSGLGKFHIVGEAEFKNDDLAKLISTFVPNSKLNYKLVDFHSGRPGHDLRYAMSGLKLELLGWKPPVSIKESLKKTVEWSLANPRWL